MPRNCKFRGIILLSGFSRFAYERGFAAKKGISAVDFCSTWRKNIIFCYNLPVFASASGSVAATEKNTPDPTGNRGVFVSALTYSAAIM